MRVLHKYFAFQLLACLLLGIASQPARPDGLRPVHARKAMVVSVHQEASRAGAEILRGGGNAVDAAVATGFALAVVHPAAGNLGGGGFLLLRTGKGEVHFVDFREKAPKAASRDMYLDAQGNVIPDASLVGYKAIGVPGSVAGLVYAQKHWGKLPLKTVMEPAIRLASEGVRLTWEESQSMHEKDLALFPDSKRIFQRDGKLYEQGELFKQPELAHTLRRIAQNPDDFYKGQMARELSEDIQRGGGLITAQDLAEYEVKERPAIRGTYRGYEIFSAPPPSSGGVTMLEALNILEGYDLSKLGNRSADAIHLTAEAFRRAFYDRAEFLGDPDFSALPIAQLADKKYAKAWRESVSDTQASSSKELRRPSGFGDLDRQAAARPPYVGPEKENTTHYSVVDQEGNAVAVTTTLNDSFGSRVTSAHLGFLLNDEMDDFTSKPGVPNGYGLIQGEANAIGPGKRPLSAMAPTIVLKDGKLFMVLGSPGGPRIISTVANILMGVIDYGMDIQQAVNAPRFHHQWEPDEIDIERVGISPDTIKLLEARGHKVKAQGYWSDGECIAVDPKTGDLLGAPDGRNGGKAVGY
ncbi:MAG TPA: gamma-glutamyltransferase [Candidatus Limnocylindrales bacterium]|jgi:gamma-glutamyltranspeptidase/glutathione hydrolase|nr:gamma-glutamyltransferase [Candidatus Limnocylindrales bacterium]